MDYNIEDIKDSLDLVSIIVPIFNRDGCLEETLLSIKNQVYSNWEAVLVDDGSTDASIEIIKRFQNQDNRFRFIKRNRDPKGAPTCRNIGMENAKGKYLIFLDSDDLLAPYCLTKRVKYMEESPGLDFAVYHILTFEHEPGDVNILWNVLNEEDDLLRFFSDDTPWQTSSPIWRKDFVEKLRWNENCISGQDWDFHVRALSLSPSYVKSDDLPDCFIRRDVDVERISRNYFKVPYIMNRETIWKGNYLLLKEKGLWKKKYNLPLASFYYRFCEILIKKKIEYIEFNPWTFYRTVYDEKLLNIFTFFKTSFYLMGLYWLRNHKFSRSYFHKYVFPMIPIYFHFQNFYKTQEKIKLDGKKLKEFEEEYHKYNFNRI